MNIIVKTYGGDLCTCRPDTTWERENRDFYSPECVNEIWWTPVVFARVSKAGKCVGSKFVQRYYDGVGCGVLMYCAADLPGNPVTACADHTSILPMPLYNPAVLEADNGFSVKVTGENGRCEIFTFNSMPSEGNGWRALVEDAICKASRLISLRIGDFIAVELDGQRILASGECKTPSLQGTFCGNEVFGFEVL